MYIVKFFSALYKRPVEYNNIRNFQYTRSRNNAGKANFQLDISPESKQIRAGWLVEIWRDGKRVYWGQVLRRQKKKGKYKIFAEDANGFLRRRLLTQRPVVNQEASVEIIEKFDGLQLIGDYSISANEHIEVTSTSSYWHWEKNSLLDYVKDIGEKVENLAGNSVVYFNWIDPDLNMYFGQDGSFGYYHNLKLTNITVTEDIEATFNKITVEGLPVLTIPYGGDDWTEAGADNFWIGDSGTTLSTESSSPAPVFGDAMLHAHVAYGSSSLLSKSIAFKEGSKLDTDQWYKVEFEFRWDSVGSGTVTDIRFYVNNSSTDTYKYFYWTGLQGGSVPAEGTFATISFDLLKTPDSTFTYSYDIWDISKFSISLITSASDTYDFYIDHFRISSYPYSSTSEDASSQERYGILEKNFIARDFYTNQECADLSAVILDHYKDAKLTINASIDGFVDLLPNSTLEFTDESEGITYKKSLSSITYYVNADGSESAQLTLGDFKKSDIEVILDKVAEINRNANLLEFPYKIV